MGYVEEANIRGCSKPLHINLPRCKAIFHNVTEPMLPPFTAAR